MCGKHRGRERADATVVIAGDGLGVKQAAHGCCGSPPDAPSEGGRQEARGRRGGAQVDARHTATGFPVGLCDGATGREVSVPLERRGARADGVHARRPHTDKRNVTPSRRSLDPPTPRRPDLRIQRPNRQGSTRGPPSTFTDPQFSGRGIPILHSLSALSLSPSSNQHRTGSEAAKCLPSCIFGSVHEHFWTAELTSSLLCAELRDSGGLHR